MLRLDLICLAMTATLAGCNSDSTTAAPAVHEVRYTGTVTAPAAGGSLIYKINGTWKLDDKGALISGTDTTQIIDGKVYGYPGTVTMIFKTLCVAISGKDAWALTQVTSSTDPAFAPVGGIGVLRVSATGGVAKGNGGPRDVWYPTGDFCQDKPALPLFDMPGGSVVIP